MRLSIGDHCGHTPTIVGALTAGGSVKVVSHADTSGTKLGFKCAGRSWPLGSAWGGVRAPRPMPTRTAAIGARWQPAMFLAAVRVGMAPKPITHPPRLRIQKGYTSKRIAHYQIADDLGSDPIASGKSEITISSRACGRAPCGCDRHRSSSRNARIPRPFFRIPCRER